MAKTTTMLSLLRWIRRPYGVGLRIEIPPDGFKGRVVDRDVESG
jgi:hypothetical protein